MRNEPFSTLLVKLQNYTQETPNRMFNDIQETVLTLDSGNDNRELISEFFSKIDNFINYNCVFYGKKITKQLVDDAYINEDKILPPFNAISKTINFIIEHKKLLNSECISMLINDWIDNVFGCNQLPEKEEDRPLTCNIFVKSSYEQKTNLKKKLKKYMSPDYNKRELTPLSIVNKIADKINMIVCLGQTPYQLFTEKHPKKNKEVKKEEKIKNKSEDFDYDDIQIFVNSFVRPQKTFFKSEVEGLYFEINPFINIINIAIKIIQHKKLINFLFLLKKENY
jgi:hypothetical protein